MKGLRSCAVRIFNSVRSVRHVPTRIANSASLKLSSVESNVVHRFMFVLCSFSASAGHEDAQALDVATVTVMQSSGDSLELLSSVVERFQKRSQVCALWGGRGGGGGERIG